RAEGSGAPAVAQALLLRGEWSLARGQAADAEGSFKAAIAAFQTGVRRDLEGLARARLAQTWAASGRMQEASAALQDAVRLAGSSESLAVRVALITAGAAVHAGDAESEVAESRLRALVDQTDHAEFPAQKFEAQLSLATLLAKTGRAVEAHTVRAGVIKEARASGFLGLASDAAQR
ncbi:MAG: hypothetical protein JST92_16265, partial [Deltaproteobacteria bacterium]|nr:hypothetical protein [Deltaproteobacteria bacterium]